MILKRNILWILLIICFRLNAQDSTDFKPGNPVFKLQSEQLMNKNRRLYFTVLTGYRAVAKPFYGTAGLNFNNYRDSVNGTQRLAMYNLSIPEMLSHFPVNPHKLFLEVKDPSKYVYDSKYGSKEDWIKKNTYCYEWVAPIGTLSVNLLNSSLARLFDIQFGLEKRMVPVLVLFRTSQIDKLKSAGKGESKYDEAGNFNNKPISENRFSSQMDITYEMLPVVDETGYKGPVDMQLNIKDWRNLAEVRKALQRYDLDLKEGKREIEVLVIKEINSDKE